MLGRRILVAAFGLLPCAMYTAPVAADAQPNGLARSFADKPWHAEVMLGAGTLVGYAGFTIGYNVHQQLELGAGLGVNALGPMGGTYARLRPLVGVTRRGQLHALSIDTGISVGRYQDYFDDNGDFESDHAMWLQLEMSWETWSVEGMTVRIGGGLTTMLNPGSIECKGNAEEQQSCGRHRPQDWPVLTIGFGHVF